MNIVGYRRVSTQEQGQKRNGLDGQTADVEAYAAAQGAQIIAW